MIQTCRRIDPMQQRLLRRERRRRDLKDKSYRAAAGILWVFVLGLKGTSVYFACLLAYYSSCSHYSTLVHKLRRTVPAHRHLNYINQLWWAIQNSVIYFWHDLQCRTSCPLHLLMTLIQENESHKTGKLIPSIGPTSVSSWAPRLDLQAHLLSAATINTPNYKQSQIQGFSTHRCQSK